LAGSLFDYNIRRASCVCRGKMEKSFRVSGKLNEGPVLWFVNRGTEGGYYALDEAFSREEAASLRRLLKRRNLECRIHEVPGSAAAEQQASWNLIGKVVELEQEDADQLSFSVVGCLEA
jgi:hypothetical protein